MNNADNQSGSERALFQEAIRLSRRGQYSQAIEKLDSACEKGDCTEEQMHDLKARIYAQQGEYYKAELHWKKALDIAGANPEYTRAIKRIKMVRKPIQKACSWYWIGTKTAGEEELVKISM